MELLLIIVGYALFMALFITMGRVIRNAVPGSTRIGRLGDWMVGIIATIIVVTKVIQYLRKN